MKTSVSSCVSAAPADTDGRGQRTRRGSNHWKKPGMHGATAAAAADDRARCDLETQTTRTRGSPQNFSSASSRGARRTYTPEPDEIRGVAPLHHIQNPADSLFWQERTRIRIRRRHAGSLFPVQLTFLG